MDCSRKSCPTLKLLQDLITACRYLNLTPQQCQSLVEDHHIYLPPNGRINISGLNQSNIATVAKVVDYVVRLGFRKEAQPRARVEAHKL